MFDIAAPAATLVEGLDRLDAELDGLLALEVQYESEDDLRAALAELVRVEARLAAVKARVTREFDVRKVWAVDEANSSQAWLRNRLRISGADASGQVSLGRHLARLPATLAALEKGEVTASHVRCIGRLDNRRTGYALARDEEMIVGWARDLGFDDFRLRLIAWAIVNDPDGPDPNPRADRWLRLAQSFGGGYDLAGWLDTITGAALADALERRETDLFRADWDAARQRLGREPTTDDLDRTDPQRRVDALMWLVRDAESVPANAKRPQPLISIATGPEPFAQTLRTHRGDPLTPTDVSAHLTDARIEHLTLGDHQTLVKASKQRTFPALLARIIRIRDQRCDHHTCDEPAHRCQIDHIIESSKGGPTSIDNGRLLCAFHNQLRNTRPPPDTG
jgi:hypothetical protein